MPAFRVRGATGQAPTTSYFGYVPDKYTLLLPTYINLSDSFTDKTYVKNAAATYLNVFIPWNLSFGGGSNTLTSSFTDFITAPDGTTNTMQRLAETTANTKHFCQAGNIQFGPIGGILRFAGFFKNAGRRIILDMNNGAVSFSAGLPVGGTGCKAIFDLAGGQVGVAAATYGSQSTQWKAIGQGIVPYGNGVYLCYVDAFMDNRTITALGDAGQSSVFIYCTVYLDNGTGTNAESSTYAGDGTSGVYGWRMNLMPVTAYKISQTVMFDDFIDTSGIDITNSYAPGFKWYSGGGWHYTQGGAQQESVYNIQYTVSGSLLNLIPQSQGVNGFNNGVILRSAAPVPGNGTVRNAPTVGNAWVPPFMIEFSSKMVYDHGGQVVHNAVATWGWSLEFVNGANQIGNPGDGSPGNPPITIAGINGTLLGYEWDLMEYGSGSASQGGYYGGATFIQYQIANGDIEVPKPGGLQAPQWVNDVAYGFSIHESVFNVADSTFYWPAIANQNSQPPSVNWQTTNISGPVNPVFFNYNQLHTFTYMRLPYLPGVGVVNNVDPNTNTTSPGLLLGFMDGINMSVVPYAPWSNETNPNCYTTDYQHYILQHGGAYGVNADTTNTYSIDWVRVSQ